jgi:RHS repeat-associated protein
VTGYAGGWTAAVTYDNNGNILTKTDARNITTTFTYDQVKRITTVRYSNDPQNTAGVDNYYDGYRSGNYTSIANVKGHLWQNETLGQVRFTLDNFDVMGRATIQRQQFWSNSAWSGSYQVSVAYDLSGALTNETYPSGHTITNQTDAAGRLSNFSGNLGDGVSRTYTSNFQYNEFGGLQQEQFGTQTALYHKQRYNVRGQLWDMRLSTVAYGSDPTNGDRGSIVNYYSNGYTQGGSGTDNNGNLLRQESYVPSGPYFQQSYAYDNLNRLTSVSEKLNGTGSDTLKQVYNYDRWGNRSVDYGQSSTNVPRPTYTVDTSTNRLVAPSGYNYGYDAAGNQTNDTYTGGGQRVFDAENHMISAQEASGSQYYKYSGSGLRVRRIVSGSEVWQIYGISGGLLAEYQAGAASFVPTREYGYRGGQLLTTISNGDAGRLSRFVYNLYYGALRRDPTSQELADKTSELATAGAQGQSQLLTKATEIARALFVSTTYETSPSRSDTQYVADLYYAYLHRAPDDSGLGFWAGGAAGSLQNRINVLSAFEGSDEFHALVSTLYGSASSDNDRTEHFVNNFYLASLGRAATSTELQSQRDRLNNAAAVSYATVQGEAETMGRELLASQVTNFSVSETQFVTNLYEAFLQRGPDAGGLSFWASQAGTNNSTARQNVLNSFATSGNFRELAGTLYREVFWLVNDQLGTPRIVVDKSGSLASVKRHDYLPFGEEIGGAQVALIGGRQGTAGYVADSVRQKFTGYESDGETGLNYAQARYQSGAQGRFTSIDPFGASASVANPQSFNRYSYVNNNPTNLTDPTGMMAGAEYGWSAVQDGFWGNSIPFNQNHFGGPEAIAQAESRHDRWVDIDRAGGDYGDDDYPDTKDDSAGDSSAAGKAGDGGEGEVTVTAEVTGVAPEPQAQESGESLAQIAVDGIRNNPGLLNQMNENRNSAIPVEIVACQAAKESAYSQLSMIPKAFKEGGNYKSTIRGGDGEVGLLQLKPSTANLSAKALENVSVNVKAGTNMLASLKTKYGMEGALVAYNWGPENIRNTKMVNGRCIQDPLRMQQKSWTARVV